MKKLLILMLAGFAFLVIGCQNSVDSEAEKAKKDVTTPDNKGDDTENGGNTESPINIGDDGTVTIGARSLEFISETTETVDSVTYKVKNYADVYVVDPYFYTYYKLYYSNDKLRRLHVYYHDFTCKRDYKYTEFVEHECNQKDYYDKCQKYSYHENGRLESYYRECVEDGYLWWDEERYNSDGNLISERSFKHDEEHPETTYNKEKVYYTNGNKKLSIEYKNNSLDYFASYYETGFCEKFYCEGYLYTYEDGKTKKASTNESDFSTKTTCTEDEALALIETIKNS